MARQAITLAGAFIGAAIGGPTGARIGMFVGQIIGGLVDPEIIKAPSIGDISQQTSSEGVPCPLYAGTAGGAGNLIYVSEPDIVDGGTVGKGGPQQEEPDRAYVTFIVRIGASLFDGPGYRVGITSLIKVWEDEKLVYDVSPTSVILEESAKYAEGFTFYPGTETQMPDPDVEAIEGVANVPAYRGRAIFVKKRHDVTDRRGSLPSYRFEVSVNGVPYQAVTLATNRQWYSGQPSALDFGGADMDFSTVFSRVRLSPDGVYAVGIDRGSTVNNFELTKFTAGAWTNMPAPANPTVGSIPSDIAWHPSGEYLAATYLGTATAADTLQIYKLVGDTLTAMAPPADLPGQVCSTLAWNALGTMLATTQADTGARILTYDFNEATGVLTNKRASPNLLGNDNDFTRLAFHDGGEYLACGGSTSLVTLAVAETPIRAATATAGAANSFGQGLHWRGDYLITMGDIAEKGRVYAFDDTYLSEAMAFSSNFAVQPTGTPVDLAASIDGRYIAIGNSTSAAPQIYDLGTAEPVTATKLTSPATGSGVVSSVSFTRTQSAQIEAGVTNYEQVVLATGRRVKVPNSAWNLPGLDAKVIRGCVAASQNYTGQDFINSLRLVFPSDGACYDGQIHINLRGGDVDVELDEEFMVDDQDDGEQEETLRNADDKRKAPIRRPYKVNLMFPNAKVGYNLTKATSPNYGDRGDAVGEVTLEVSVVLDETTEAPQLADVLDKIGRMEALGELVRKFPEGETAKLVPGSIVRLTGGDLTRRLRVQTDRAGDGTKRLHMLMDSVHANSSQATSQSGQEWPTPPPSLPGETIFALMNLPSLADAQDVTGLHIAICGLPGTAWRGTGIAYRVAGSTTWTSLGNFTRRAIMGELLEALPAASEFYTDTTNVLRVLLIDDDEIDTLTDAEWLSEGNPAAVVYPDGRAEILQPRDSQDDSDREWALSHLERGRLATTPGPHAIGARFVMLDGSIFVPLPTALRGQELEFRFTSIGNNPETAPIASIVWDPVVSQTEFPAANLLLDRDGDDIDCRVVPRHRLGTEDAPVASLNFDGYRWTATDGSNTATADTDRLAPTTTFDVTGWASPVTVTVALINRLTGLGPDISESVA